MTEQAKRGKVFFAKSPKAVSCGACHRMEGEGRAVGPDLIRLARLVGPQGLVLSIHMKETAFLQTVVTGGRRVPAMVTRQAPDEIEYWDLSTPSPVQKKQKMSEISEVKPGADWQHPPAAAAYSEQELADIIGYMLWAARGATQEVRPGDFKLLR
jgi:mono/diheme cytochrome c family protein